MSRWDSRAHTRRLTFVGMLCALCVGAQLFACMLPSGWLGITAISGVIPAVALLAGGAGAGIFCWIVSGILGIIFLPNKVISILFLIFFGLYPIIKYYIEKINRRLAQWGVKLLYFNATLLVVRYLLQGVLLDAFTSAQGLAGGVVCVGANILFLLYDVGLSGLLVALQRRLRISHQ